MSNGKINGRNMYHVLNPRGGLLNDGTKIMELPPPKDFCLSPYIIAFLPVGEDFCFICIVSMILPSPGFMSYFSPVFNWFYDVFFAAGLIFVTPWWLRLARMMG